jgi:arginase family enzyme
VAEDGGFAPFHSGLDPLDVVKSVALIEGLFEQVRAIGAAPVVIGGDHTVPSPICARAHERARPG